MPNTWKPAVRILTEGDAHVLEDTCGFAGPSAWVIDGATPLLEQLGLPGPSDPAWYAGVLSSLLAEHSAGTFPGPGADDVLAAALARMDQVASGLVGGERIRFPSAALCLAQLTGDGVEIIVLADCHAVVELADGSIHHVTAVRAGPLESAQSRAVLPEAAVRSLTAEEIAALTRADRERRNTADGIWVARREPEAAQHAELVRLGPPARVLLASDGAWRAVDLGLVDGPEALLAAASTPLGAQQLLLDLRRHQLEISESADDATLLVLVPEPVTGIDAGTAFGTEAAGRVQEGRR